MRKKDISINLIHQIIFSRIEEILELSVKSIKSNLNLKLLDQCKIVFMGEGSKILDNQFMDKISFMNEVDCLEETTEGICQSGLELQMRANKQEVLIVPKKQTKQGFFEKLFHFFR